MAGDWIKLECSTPDKPEIMAIAKMANVPPELVLGYVVRLWIWADQQSQTGSIPGVSIETLSLRFGYADVLVGMQHVGWLKELSTGVVFTNFDRHNGKTAKNRALAKNRMQRFRYAAVTQNASPEKRRINTNTNNASNNTPANDRPAGKPISDNSRSNPSPSAHSPEKAAAAIQEARDAAKNAIPMPENIRQILGKGK